MKPNLIENLALAAKTAKEFPKGTLQVLIDGFVQEQADLERLLDTEPSEGEIHKHLECHPRLLVQALLNGVYAVATPRMALDKEGGMKFEGKEME